MEKAQPVSALRFIERVLLLDYSAVSQLRADDILSELQLKSEHNVACQIHSLDVDYSPRLLGWRAVLHKPETCLKAFCCVWFFIQTAAYARVCIPGNV